VERIAQCHCGALRAILTGEPDRVNVCHCQACQRRTGAVMHSGATCKKSQVRIEGPSHVYVREATQGRKVYFHFCPTCGSSVYWEFDLAPDHVGIAVGCFADPDFPPPNFSIFEESMAKWVALPMAAHVRYEQGKPN
jgi:hypothetical protein